MFLPTPKNTGKNGIRVFTRTQRLIEYMQLYIKVPNITRTLIGLKSMVYLSNRSHFLWVYRCDNPRGMLGEHENSFYITSRRQHPKWVIKSVNP